MRKIDSTASLNKPHGTILSIDLKSFYASVECVDRNLDPFITPLVVADKSRGKGTIILAVTPFLKAFGIPSRLRLGDLPYFQGMIVATPRMARYLEVSSKVVNIFLNFVSASDLHVYSIDESFLDISSYAEAKKIGARAYAEKIMKAIKDELGLTVTIGIGENIFMAKAAMDIEAKKSPDYIASWTYDDIPTKLWPVEPLSSMWGIGSRMEKRLNALGYISIGDIALATPEYFKSKFGLIGEEIYNHSHGIDYAKIGEIYTPISTSLTVGQSLYENYGIDDAILVIKEMAEELVMRLLLQQQLAGTIGLSVTYDYKDGGGFSGAKKLSTRSNDEKVIRETLVSIFKENMEKNQLVRRVNLFAADLTSSDSIQLDLFTGEEEVAKRLELAKTIMKIKKTYGDATITKATSAYEKSNFKKRTSEIGGHKR